MAFSMSGSAALISFATVTVLAAGVFRMLRPTLGMPTPHNWDDRAASDSSAYTEYRSTGSPLVENVTMLEGWACGGRAARARSRLLERVWRAAVVSVPSLNCTITTDAPDAEVEST